MIVDAILDWLWTWSEVVAGLGSLLLSGGLVILYRKQQGLLKREMNRDIRKQHTETLRDRIRAWHGEENKIEDVTMDIQTEGNNLPVVQAASVRPSPALVGNVYERQQFRAAPEAIEKDMYFQDLLNNHAPDLKELKEDVEKQYDQFESARESFVGEFSSDSVVGTDSYTLKPKDQLTKWAFEQAVKYHRENRDIRSKPHETDKERLQRKAKGFLKNDVFVDSDSGTKFYSPEHRDAGPATYEAIAKSGDLEKFEEFEEEVVQKLTEIHMSIIDEIGEDGEYRYAIEAAEILDNLESSVEELRRKLVEYEGHPLYSGDCKYLDEASV